MGVGSFKMASDEQIEQVFNFFDLNGNRTLDREEVLAFLQSHYDPSGLKTHGTTLEEITDAIFSNNTEQLDLDGFRQVFHASVSEKDTEFVQPSKPEAAVGRIPAAKTSSFWRYLYISNRTMCLIMYFAANFILFASKFITYPCDIVVGYSVCFAKGLAQIILLNAFLVIVPVCRNVIAYLRQYRNLWRYIPFDENIDFHKLAGRVIILSSIAHTFFWILIIYFARHATEADFQVSLISHLDKIRTLPLEQLVWEWPIWTGILMLFMISVAAPFTFEKVRRAKFNLFWYTHLFLLPFLAFLMVHGIAEWMNVPQAHLWILFPCVLYIGERHNRLGRSGETQIVRVQIEKDMVALFMSKPHNHFNHFEPGMYLFLNVPCISKFEWHPFTISSAPGDPLLSLHIRASGDWTQALYTHIKSIEMKRKENNNAFPFPNVLLDGPIGAPTQLYNRFRVVILIGAGIGVTPFASVLRNIMNTWEDHRCSTCNTVKHPRNFQVQKLYFYWTTREQDNLQWFADTLNHLSEMDRENRLELYTYYSKIKRNSCVSPMALIQTLMYSKEGQDIVSGLTSRHLTQLGRPNWTEIFQSVAAAHLNEKIGVFLCGPQALDQTVERVCAEMNQKKINNVTFSYHPEKF